MNVGFVEISDAGHKRDHCALKGILTNDHVESEK